MSERSKKIFELRSDFDSRRSYIKAILGVLVPSKIKALRLKSNMPRQRDLAIAAMMHQSRISMFETPGEANVTLETLAKLAAAFKVGLIVDFVPFSEMLRWENEYSQDTFDVLRLDADSVFLNPTLEHGENTPTAKAPNLYASAVDTRYPVAQQVGANDLVNRTLLGSQQVASSPELMMAAQGG